MASTPQAIIVATISFLFITLFSGSIIFICKRIKKPANNHAQARSRNRTGPAPVQHDLTSIITEESTLFDPSLDQLSMPELSLATNNFSQDLIIGDGSFGLVYRAKLSNGVTVAIKKLDQNAFQGFREFRAEMETLGKLRHDNIVRILGYCISGDDRVLIYEFLENGNLDQWLHDTSDEYDYVAETETETDRSSFRRLPLNWDTRMKIVKGIANGLAYLHGLNTPIIHRDIKASNVLLDSDFEAHISDFGLARRIENSSSHVSTQVAGTMGYMPPEYWEGNIAATPMADAYSFGILMIEIATQKRPSWPVKVEGKEVGLAQWARKMVEEGKEMEMVDSNTSREELIEGKVNEYFRIACMCSKEASRERPLMSKVIELLDLC